MAVVAQKFSVFGNSEAFNVVLGAGQDRAAGWVAGVREAARAAHRERCKAGLAG